MFVLNLRAYHITNVIFSFLVTGTALVHVILPALFLVGWLDLCSCLYPLKVQLRCQFPAEESRCLFSKAARYLLFALPTDRIAQTMAFVEPLMEHCSVHTCGLHPLSLEKH